MGRDTTTDVSVRSSQTMYQLLLLWDSLAPLIAPYKGC